MTKQEILLVSTKKKGESLRYEVEKEGILQLRKYKSKKFRVVFNIFPHNQQSHNIADPFNENLFSQSSSPQQVTIIEQPQSIILKSLSNDVSSYLTICTKTKQLSDNRIIVTLNAYLNEVQPPNLVILGYLISSLVLYHNWNNEFSQQSQLSELLSALGKLLGRTHIDELNQNIKFKSGYEKSPYFLCLIGKNSKLSDTQNIDYQNYLNDFYRFQSQKQHSKINSALQTLIDYFPQRSSSGINVRNDINLDFTQQGLKQIQKLGIIFAYQIGKQFQQKLIGRQMFNFEFTGTTIENLVFELCEYFNTGQEINLTEIYNKVIINKKSRIQTETIELYLALIQKRIFLNNRIDLDDASFGTNSPQTNSILPISDFQLHSIIGNIIDFVIRQTEVEAMTCMNLTEYVNAKQKITNRITSYEQKIFLLNAQLGNRFLQECYSILDIDQGDINLPLNQEKSLQMVREMFDLLENKIGSFSYECIGLFAESDTNASRYNDTFLKVITSYLQKLKTFFSSAISQFELQKRTDRLQIETLNYELKKCQAQKQAVQKQYQLQLLVEAQLKSKFKQHILEQSSFSTESSIKKKEFSVLRKESLNFYNSSKEFYKMKKQIEELEEEVKDKNNQIQELTQILQKFQSTSKMTNSLSFYEKKTDKFNEQTQKLIAEANSKILKFYQILQEVKQVQKHYESVKKFLMKERQKIIQEKRQSMKQMAQLKEKAEKVDIENKKLNEIIVEEKKTLQNFRKLKETLKSNISELESQNAETTCALAQVQGELEFYRKALTLVVEQYVKGKSQNLMKFYKFLEHPKLKELLKPLISKH